MATAASIIAETRRYLYAGARDAMNTLNGALTDSTTSVILTYDVGACQPGSYISVDLEIMYVVAVTQSSKTATVIRGQLGSTAAAHSSGAVVSINPRFPDFSILEAINADMADMSAAVNGLFQVKNVTLTYNAAIDGYDLTSVSSIIGRPLRVKYDETGPRKIWPEILNYDLRRSSDTSDFASGFALVLGEPAQPGRSIRVAYAAPFVSFTTTAQDAQTYAGLAATMNDIPALGAALRLQLVREGQRNFNDVQGDTRRPVEVPVGAQLTGARGLMQLRQSRIEAEASRLRRDWPVRRKVA